MIIQQSTFNKIKYKLNTFILIALAFSNFNTAQAQCGTIQNQADLTQIWCPIVRVLNAMYVLGGVIFICMVFVTAYKFAMAQGDPRELQGAKQSLTYTIAGFAVTVSVYVIVSIIGVSFGSSNVADTNNAFRSIGEALCDISDLAGITGAQGCP